MTTLNSMHGRRLLRNVNTTEAPFDHRSALEDSGAFVLQHSAAAPLMEYAFGQDNQTKGERVRTAVYAYLDSIKMGSKNELYHCTEQTRDWYDRAYARAIGFQHAQAAGDKSLVFETVHTQGLPAFHRRDGKAESEVLMSADLLTSDDRAFLLCLRASWESGRDCARVRAVSWHDQPKEQTIDEKDLGQRALALLRGSTHFVRLWTEEASQVGPRVPAVIDEEYFGAEQGVKLNRVEYFGDIGP